MPDGRPPRPTTLPERMWHYEDFGPSGWHYTHHLTQQSVIVSDDTELDGKRWRHFSTSFPSRLPTWAEFIKAKEDFLGTDSRAVQVIPPRSEWVNIHPYCLHLFVCLEGDVVPDFTRGRGAL